MNTAPRRPLLVAALALLPTLPWALSPDDEPLVLDAAMHHLGDDATPEWGEAPEQPEPGPLVWRFQVPAHPGEAVLALRQRHVNDAWSLALNGRPLTELRRGDGLVEELYPIPAGALRAGENVLRLTASTTTDDITVGDLRLHLTSLAELLDLATLTLRVRDGDGGGPLPARLTLVDAAGALPALHADDPRLALRDGVVYTAHGEAVVQVPRGRYTVWAQRGTEWSRARADLDLTGDAAALDLELVRELDTTGLVAADTHIHTLTFSGHGDASLDERQITLAGEGVELAIATDHNHNTDYTDAAARLDTSAFYTPVTGNEVTTPIGHFNAFPLDPEDAVPPHDLRDWTATVQGMREAGAGVIILNHPRWPSFEGGPFGVEGLDRATGARASGAPFLFDALELVNSTDDQPEPMVLLEDWFALLNRGERLVAVGSSDSHTVGDPVGQGRTYVRCADDDPASIDVAAAAASLAAGRSSVSLGLLVDVTVDGAHGPGALAPAGDGSARVAVRVAAPSWVRPERLELFVDGVLLATQPVPMGDGPNDLWLESTLELPSHDAWLVAVVHGAAVEGPGWPSLNAYTIGFTNPVWLDADGDGRWTPPRRSALERLADVPAGAELDPASLEGLDEAAVVHYLELARERRQAQLLDELRRLAGQRLGGAGPLSRYLDGLR